VLEVWEGQRLELKHIGLAQQAVDVDVHGVSRKLDIEASTKAVETVGMILLDVELIRQLTVDSFNQLTHLADHSNQEW